MQTVEISHHNSWYTKINNNNKTSRPRTQLFNSVYLSGICLSFVHVYELNKRCINYVPQVSNLRRLMLLSDWFIINCIIDLWIINRHGPRVPKQSCWRALSVVGPAKCILHVIQAFFINYNCHYDLFTKHTSFKIVKAAIPPQIYR